MADEMRGYVDIPEDEEFVNIAVDAANGQLGTGSDDGDLQGDDWLNSGDSTPISDSRSRRPQRAAVHGQAVYVSVPLGNDFLYAFGAADEMIITREGEDGEYLQIPERDRMAMYIKGLIGRDMEADERRTPDKKIYWLGGLYRGATYKNLIVDTHMRDFDKTLKEQWNAKAAIQFKRMREELGPEWSDSKIAYMLGMDSGEDE